MEASYKRYQLNFKKPSGTSRGILKTKDTWFIILKDQENLGIGECGMFKGLSIDDRPDFEDKLQWACDHIELGLEELKARLFHFPSIQFGLEIAFKSLSSTNGFDLFPSEFTLNQSPIQINGLIWMGTENDMKQQAKEKLEAGFDCIKMKIGAIDFEKEINLIKMLRKEFSSEDLEIRVDANGAFLTSEALEKIKRLSDYNIHSIEQPIKQGQWNEMTILCEKTPLPIALDEELIGIFSFANKKELLKQINPQYIILKPTLVGGFSSSEEWISLAEKQNIGWWITSALESNVGLNAIAQWTYNLNSKLPQGLGTGSLFSNNFDSPLIVKNGTLQYEKNTPWNFNI